MATKLAPAHRERDGQPIKTGDVARLHARGRDRTPKRSIHARACPYPDCACEEKD